MSYLYLFKVKEMPSKLTTQEFIRRANYLHDNFYDYSKVEYKHSGMKVIITCNTHGDFLQRPCTHLEGKGCPKCKAIKTAKALKYTTADFVKKAKEKHGEKYSYDESVYVGAMNDIAIICFKHGVFNQIPTQHLRGHGCPDCATNGNKLTLEEFVRRSKIVHGDRYDYSSVEYINGYTKVKIGCSKHGVFEQIPYSHMNTSGCPHCQTSKGEERIASILRKNTINFVREYKIPNSEYKLRYDFYISEHNVIIEFHGIQHYEPVKYFGGEETLSKVKFRDMIKRELAQLSGYRYLEIHYTYLDELSEEEFEQRLLKCIYE